jgi:hypothetical protein
MPVFEAVAVITLLATVSVLTYCVASVEQPATFASDGQAALVDAYS